MEYTVIHDEKVNRFEVFESGQIGYIQYKMSDGVIDMIHTIVPKQLEGQGIASALTKYALDFVRDKRLKVIPTCPFIKIYVERHKEYEDLVVE